MPRTVRQIASELKLFGLEHPQISTRSLHSATFVCQGPEIMFDEALEHYWTCAWCRRRYAEVNSQTLFYKHGPLPPA
jgi:hypothetical protein